MYTLLLLACASPVPQAPAVLAVPATGSWTDEVAARIQEDVYGFVSGQGVYTAECPAQGIVARFDADGAHLASGGDELTLRLIGHGRAARLIPAAPTVPGLGACVPERYDPTGACVRRLEYRERRDAGMTQGVTEAWTNGPEGMEVSWTVATAPSGAGPLVVDVQILGASVAVTAAEVRLQGETGTDWTVSGLAAWDSAGMHLDSRFVARSGGYAVTIDDRRARYPVHIDPLYTTASATLTGAAAGDSFGISVSGAGDVNGDGYDDVIVGADEYDGKMGRAYVFHGSATGMSTTASTTLTGEVALSAFGYSVSGAGDVNADGYADVVVGAYGYGSSTGRAYVYLGSSSGVATTAGTTLTGEAAADYFGVSVADAGDVNADGYDDIVVGAPFYGISAGRAYVYAGSSRGVSPSATPTLDGEASNSLFGVSVSGAGDVNNDGYDDVIVGARYDDAASGRAYLYAGSATGASTRASTTLYGEATDDGFGQAVSRAGDVDGDGYDDVIVGSPYFDRYTGRAYIYAGSSSGVSGTASVSLAGESAGDAFGTSVADAGDVDHDGYGDVLVGASRYSGDIGRAYLYGGAATGASAVASLTLTGTAANDNFGHSVAAAGDIDGDGYDDVIIGALGWSSYTGAAYLYQGYVDADGDGYAAAVDCDDGDAAVNPAAVDRVADGVDQDCDGVDTCYTDSDGDNYGTTVETDGSTLDCASGAGAPTATDCDDSVASTYPGANEVCNGADDDCDEAVDEDAIDAPEWFPDGDGDGYTLADGLLATCSQPAGYAAASTVSDCDDTDAARYPGAFDIPDDGVDQDCDGVDAMSETGETGETAQDSGETGETAQDSGETGETGETAEDSGETAEDTGINPTDTGEATGKFSGCGCAAATGAPGTGALLLGLMGLSIQRRRRSHA